MTPSEEAARRKTILQLAAEAEIDVRTAARALDLGVGAIHSVAMRARVTEALSRMALASGKVRAT